MNSGKVKRAEALLTEPRFKRVNKSCADMQK